MIVQGLIAAAAAAVAITSSAGTSQAPADLVGDASDHVILAAAGADCGFHTWAQSYTNCQNFNADISVIYAMGGGPHGDMLYTTVPYCVPAGQTKKFARPDLGLGLQHVGGDKPC